MNIFVAMSGGVDSSVAAVLLKEQGHNVTGITMQLWPRAEDDSGDKSCCGLDAIDDARRVAEAVGIPHYVVNMRDDFEKSVIDDFIGEYSRGRTPNPCVKCNEIIKFDLLLKKVLGMGADALATGHYARIAVQHEIPNTKYQIPNISKNDLAAHGSQLTAYRLLKGLDEKKDQSYFLWTFTQEQLAKIVLPLGGLHKTEVREIAKRHNLPVAEKSESQEICFVPADNYRVFLRERGVADMPGIIINTAGNAVGKHQGTSGYTVGQRKGLGLGGSADSENDTEPMYVLSIDTNSKTVTVGPRAKGYKDKIKVSKAAWISSSPPAVKFQAKAKIRYNAKSVSVEISLTDGDSATLLFKEPQFAPAPGQSVVFYEGDMVLGGAVIT